MGRHIVYIASAAGQLCCYGVVQFLAAQKECGRTIETASEEELALWSGGCLGPIAHLLPPAFRCCATPGSGGTIFETLPQPERILRAAGSLQHASGGSAQVRSRGSRLRCSHGTHDNTTHSSYSTCAEPWITHMGTPCAQALEAALEAAQVSTAAAQRARQGLQQLHSAASSASGGGQTVTEDEPGQTNPASWVHAVPLNDHCPRDRCVARKTAVDRVLCG